MPRRFDVHLLNEPPTIAADDPYDLPDGGIVCRQLPFVVYPTGEAPPRDRFDVVHTWPRYPRSRLKILHALDAAKSNNAHVYRLSLGVISSRRIASDALGIATRSIIERNRIVVAAAGNWGPGMGTLSDIARTESVTLVAACDSDGVPLDSSSRGRPGGRTPDLAADGTDSSGISPAGTSLAAARVAVMCVWVRSMLQCVVVEATSGRDGEQLVRLPPTSRLAHIDSGFTQKEVDSLLALRVGRDVYQGDEIYSGASYRRMAWLNSVVNRARESDVGVYVDNSQAAVLAILREAADTVNCKDVVTCGAGFVSHAAVRAVLADMTPSRFLRLFVDDGVWDRRRAEMAAELDDELGVLWTTQELEMLEQLYAHEYDDLFIEIGAPGATGHGNSMLRTSNQPSVFTRPPVVVNINEQGIATYDDPENPDTLGVPFDGK